MKCPARRFLCWTLWLLSTGACASSAAPVASLQRPVGATPASASSAESLPFVSPASYEQLIRAELHMSRGELREAIAAYRAAIAFGEDDPYLFARLAYALDRAGLHQAAREALDSALAIDPRSEAAWLTAARIARARGESKAALAAYERAQAGAVAPATALERIEYLRELGNDERARVVLQELSTTHASGVRDRLRIDLELAITDGKGDALARCACDWAALAPSQHGESSLARRAARALVDAGQPQAALYVLDALPIDASDAEIRLQALLALGRTAQCDHLLATTPPAWLGGPVALARAYLEIGRADAAIAVLEERAENDAGREQVTAQAWVDIGQPTRAANALAPVLADPAQRASATRVLESALQASGLPSLAREIAARERAAQ